MKENNKSALLTIFLTVFLYLVGFGIIIPILPMLARELSASPFQIGLLMASYSLMQFIFSPFWGRLSDRVGRRPIILLCLFGEIFCYIFFAYARSFEMLLAARLLAGFFGASISTASAAISDVTGAKERSKGMALIGMSFGLGFLIGPAIGGLLSHYADKISQAAFFSMTFTGLSVAALYFLTFVFAFFNFQETLSAENKANSQAHASSSLKEKLFLVFKYFRKPVVGIVIFVNFLYTVAMANMESTLVLLMSDKFLWNKQQMGFAFAYIGFCSVLFQGGLVRRLIPKLGEKKLLITGVVLLGLSLLVIPWIDRIAFMAINMTVLSLGTSFISPSIMGSASLLSEDHEQGIVMGVVQSASSLGRIVGPLIGGALYTANTSYPYFFGALVCLAGFFLLIRIFEKLPPLAKS